MKECALKECKITFEVIPRNKKYCSERHKNRATSRRSYDRITNDPARNQKRKDYIRKYMRNRYQTDYEFNAGEYDATIAFFVKRGFTRTAAESTAYVIMSQAKIDNIKPQLILDKLTYADEATLSEIITIILNANRYKSSRLGVRQTLVTKETVSRNMLD